MIALATRVRLSAALVLTIFVAITALALERAFEESVRSALRERLLAQLYMVMSVAEVDRRGRLQMPLGLGEARLNLPGSGLYARIGGPQGRTLWQSPSAIGLRLPSPPASAAGERLAEVSLQEQRYFLVATGIEWETPVGNVPLMISVMEERGAFDAQIADYRHTLWGWLGAMAGLLLVALGLSLSWGLRPLRTVAREVQAIESGRQEALNRDYPRELRRLTDNINTLLHHEHAQQARYKNALADLAHSLKTPLAVLRGIKESEVGERSQLIDEQVSRMDNIVHYQLQRAATAGRSALAAPIAITPVIERLVTTLQKVHRDKGVAVHTELAEGAQFRGDEGDLMELLGNLLDNAFKWCHSAIWLQVTVQGRTLQLVLEDDGPGIDDASADQVLSRGVRLDEATPGHGIGLPMVRDIVAAYEGRLAIDRSGHGGARFTITLPGSQADA